jgi:hypothetical protein
MSSSDIINKLEKIYLMSGYLDKHSKDIWVSIIICVLFFLFIYYYHIANVLEVVRVNWNTEKSNPMYMPFAGFINKPKNQSYAEFTSNNFMTVVQAILKSVSENAFKPFQAVLDIINKIIAEVLQALDFFRGIIDRIRTVIASIYGVIYGVVSNLGLEFMEFIIKFRDTMAKINGVLTTALYVLFGAYMTMESMFFTIVDFLTLILIVIAAIIVVYICIATGLFPIPIFGAALAAPSIILGIITMLVMLGILILVIIFNVFMMRILNISTPPLPGVPSCFAGDTLIPLAGGGAKKIKDIKNGDILEKGGKVTAVMQFTAQAQNVYELNGVCVTGEHRVFHPVLQWIKVKAHPESRYLPAFSEPFVYCLNTELKEFSINATRFSDWDDIDDKVVQDLNTHCVLPGYLPAHFTGADIHTYLASGLHPATKITLQNGSVIPINAININDVLWGDTKVLGIIQIAGHDIKQYTHAVGLTGTKNIHIADSYLGIVRGLSSECSTREPILYHLLTDTTFFVANAIKINDYNYGIDAYLS